MSKYKKLNLTIMNSFITFVLFSYILSIQALLVTVGTGTPASCTFISFTQAIGQIKNEINPKSSVSPHILAFNCSSSPVNMVFTQYFFINTSLLIDATGNDITFDGASQMRFFVVALADTKWGIGGVDCNLLLTNIKFINGKGNDLIQASRPNYGSPQIDSNGNFINPVKKQDGGSIYIGDSGVLIIDRCSFSFSSAYGTLRGDTAPDDITYNGGVIMALKANLVQINNSIFLNNSALDQGGVLYVSWQTNNVIIQNTIFRNNVASYTGEGGGGAIRLHESQMTVKNCTFTGNSAALGSAISNLLSDLMIDECAFDNNIAYNKLGLDHEARGTIYIDGARAQTSVNVGSIIMKNSSFTRNWSGEKGGGVYVCPYGAGNGDQIIFESLYFCNNTVQGNALIDGQTHNYGAGFSCDCGASNTVLTLKNVFLNGNDVVNKTGYSVEIEQFFISNSQIPVVEEGINVLPKNENNTGQNCPNYVFDLAYVQFNNNTTSSISTSNSNSTANDTSSKFRGILVFRIAIISIYFFLFDMN